MVNNKKGDKWEKMKITKMEAIEINKEGWNKLIKSGKKFANTILPEYGPF